MTMTSPRNLTALLPVLVVLGALGSPALGQTAYMAPDGRTYDQLVAAHVLPDPTIAPGVVNPDVTDDTAKATICVSGWTKTVRPSVAWTNTLKKTLVPAGKQMSDGELDHRLSIEDGGAPKDPKNLWFQIYGDRYGAKVKDVLETKLKTQVCHHQIGLDEARNALLGNWLTAYEKYVGPLP
jgi:hypothetical protein